MRLFVLASWILCLSCGISTQEFSERVEAAQACKPTDMCVLAGGGQCTCARPVNATEADPINKLADDVNCGGAQVECAAVMNVRCENAKCTGDNG